MIEIYGKDNCIYCKMAVDLVEKHNLQYKYYKLGSEYTVEQYQEKFPGRRTVPGIIIHNFPIGGYDELVGYVEENGNG